MLRGSERASVSLSTVERASPRSASFTTRLLSTEGADGGGRGGERKRDEMNEDKTMGNNGTGETKDEREGKERKGKEREGNGNNKLGLLAKSTSVYHMTAKGASNNRNIQIDIHSYVETRIHIRIPTEEIERLDIAVHNVLRV